MLDVDQIIEQIDASFVGRRKATRPRDYIGASSIGQECDASIAYSLRGFPDTEPEPRLQRIFQLGHALEDIVVADLKSAGVDVMDRDGLTGKQYTFEEWGGHVVCHTDGIIQDGDELYILEVKSMKATQWNKFKKHGVKKSHRYYYDQMLMMMGMSGARRAFFIAYNKDTSEYHAEVVELDELELNFISERIQRIVESGTGMKIAKDEEDWRCRGCFKHGVCWNDEDVFEVNCATCAHSVPMEDGGWWCELDDRHCAEPCKRWDKFKPKERDYG